MYLSGSCTAWFKETVNCSSTASLSNSVYCCELVPGPLSTQCTLLKQMAAKVEDVFIAQIWVLWSLLHRVVWPRAIVFPVPSWLAVGHHYANYTKHAKWELDMSNNSDPNRVSVSLWEWPILGEPVYLILKQYLCTALFQNNCICT